MLSQLSQPQTAAVMATVALISGAVGFFVKRWLSQSSTHERTALLNSLADLQAKMRSEGLDLDQIAELERMVRGKGSISTETAQAVTGQGIPDEEDLNELPQSYWTTAAMVGRASARYSVVEAQLEEALTELSMLISEDEACELNRSHVAWKVYRRRQMNYASNRFAGGSLAPLAGTLHGIEVTERRTAELRQEIESRKSEPM